MDDTSLEIKVGKVESITTEMSFTVIKKSDGSQQVRLYMVEKKGRRSGEIVTLSVEGFAELKRLVSATEAQLSPTTATSSICPNCKTPQRNQTDTNAKSCAFCGFTRP